MQVAINTICDYMKKFTDKEASNFAEYIFGHLAFFISELPYNYDAQDLNKYFERMNSTGKNLEHHEILKVKILCQLDGDVSLYMQLWNKIADVDTILLRKREAESDAEFNERKNKVLKSSLVSISESPTLVNSLKSENIGSNYSIKQIAKRDKKPQCSTN